METGEMYCTGCGAPAAGSAFCTSCGMPIHARKDGVGKPLLIIGAVLAGLVLIIAALTFLGKPDRTGPVQSSESKRSPSYASASTEPSPEPTDAPVTAAGLMNQVRADITPQLIAGNPSKYVGRYVLIECQITNIINSGDDKEANATCVGASAQGSESSLVITGAVGNLDAGQNVTLLGQVSEPTDGTNAFGASSTFPTVNMLFLNPSTQNQQTPSNIAAGALPKNPQELAVDNFYNNITLKNYDAAYSGLSNSYRSTTSRVQFEAGYATTVSVSAIAHARGDDAQTVDVVLHAVDLKDGETVNTTYVGTWRLVEGPNGDWLLDDGEFKKHAE